MIKEYYLYIIECRSMTRKSLGRTSYYTGISHDPIRRFHEHKKKIRYHGKRGYMERTNKSPIAIVYLEKSGTTERHTAEEREQQVKAWSPKRRKKEIARFDEEHPGAKEMLERKCKGGL